MESVKFCLVALAVAEEVQGFKGGAANSIFTGGPGPSFQVKRWKDREKNKKLVDLIIKAAKARFFNTPRKHKKSIVDAKKYFQKAGRKK